MRWFSRALALTTCLVLPLAAYQEISCLAASTPLSSSDGDVLIDIGGTAKTAAPDAIVRKAASTPVPTDAQEKYLAGVACLQANGASRDEKEGFRFISEAARAGLPIAQAHLGRLLRDGVGSPKNYFEAVRWFRTAADAGMADGAIDLGLLYFEGRGVHHDLVEAATLLYSASPTIHVAPSDAYPEARKALEALPEKLSPEEKNRLEERLNEVRDRCLQRLMARDGGKAPATAGTPGKTSGKTPGKATGKASDKTSDSGNP
ncbi:MAG: hypothetical protein WA705_07670 [Candidatus Ozemobacteraceae bacterium]